jgi:hypothetical protein
MFILGERIAAVMVVCNVWIPGMSMYAVTDDLSGPAF